MNAVVTTTKPSVWSESLQLATLRTYLFRRRSVKVQIISGIRMRDVCEYTLMVATMWMKPLHQIIVPGQRVTNAIGAELMDELMLVRKMTPDCMEHEVFRSACTPLRWCCTHSCSVRAQTRQISQSVSQSVSHSVRHSVRPPFGQSVGHPVIHSVSQSVNRSVSHPFGRSVRPSTN